MPKNTRRDRHKIRKPLFAHVETTITYDLLQNIKKNQKNKRLVEQTEQKFRRIRDCFKEKQQKFQKRRLKNRKREKKENIGAKELSGGYTTNGGKIRISRIQTAFRENDYFAQYFSKKFCKNSHSLK